MSGEQQKNEQSSQVSGTGKRGRKKRSELSVSPQNRKLIADKIQALLKGGSQNDLAAKSGVGQTMISAYLRQAANPSIGQLEKLAATTGKPLAWFFADDSPGEEPQHVHLVGAPPGFVAVPRLRIRASAGPGAHPDPEALQPEDEVFFREDWMRRMGINTKRAQAFTVHGRSMAPLLEDGDLVLVDRSVERLRDDGVYVVVYGDAVKVKRVHVRFDGAVVLRSEDPGIPDEILRGDELQLLRIEGQVRWFGRAL